MKKPLDKYKTLKEFYTDVEKKASRFPLKIMGKTRQKEEYTASMLAVIYQDTKDPDQAGVFPFKTAFGEIFEL